MHEQRCDHISVKMSYTTTQLPAFQFCGPYTKPHGVIWSSKYYNLQLDTKLGHGECAILLIPWACITCKNMLYKPWDSGVNATEIHVTNLLLTAHNGLC